MGGHLLAAAALLFAGNILFRHFDPHLSRGRRLLKSGVALGITALVSYYFGTSGVLVPGGLAFIPLVYVHGYWLPKQGINGWTAELRDKYYALRRIQPPDPPTGEPSGE